MIKKVISAVLAVSIVSSVFITAYAADTEKAKKYFKPADLSGMFDFMTGKSADKASENLDVNEDGVVNILDTISMKESIYEDHSYYKHVLSSSAYEKDINDSQKLNRMAETVAEIINGLFRSDSGIPEEKGRSVSFDDGSETAEEVNRIIHDKYGYRDLKWIADYSFFGQTKVICSVNNEKTGAYPLGIPDDIIIPFDKADSSFFQFMSSSDADWHSYSRTVSQLNDDAKMMYGLTGLALINALKNGKYTEELAGERIIVNGADDDDLCVQLNKLARFSNKFNFKWAIHISDGKVVSVYLTDLNGKVTGAYPAAVPQNLAIPYADGLDEYASGEKSWKDVFSDKISEDSETASLPDYPEISENDALIKAYYYFSYMESDNPDVEIEDGVYNYDNFEEELPELMNDRMFRYMDPLYKHEHINLTFLDGKLSEVEYINDGCDKPFKVSYERYLKAKEEETVKVTTSGGGSKTVSTKVIGLNDDEEKVKVPDPDHHLYYSTDADDDNTIIRLRTEEELEESSEETSRGWTVTIPDADQNVHS